MIYQSGDEKTSFKDITTYNNYYEFGTKKTDPSEYADKLTTDPWSVSIDGAVKKNKVLSVEDIIKLSSLEERVYRLRCVEGWSMVIPWVGIPLKSLLKHVSPTNNAKFVKFTTLNRPSEMIGQRYKVLDWPYIEGLRMDEAMHPLTILAVGSIRQSAAQPKRGPYQACGPMEIWLQEYQSHYKNFISRKNA